MNKAAQESTTATAVTEPEAQVADYVFPEPTLKQRLVRSSTVWVSLTLVACVLAFSILNFSAFATSANLSNIALGSAILLVLAVGSTFVIITGGVDLSIGSVLVFASVLGCRVMGDVHAGGVVTSLIGCAACLAGGAAWGAINGGIISKLKVPPLVATLGTLGMAYGAALLLSGGNDLTNVPQSLQTGFGLGNLLGVPDLVWTAVVVAVVAGIVLAGSRFGRYTYAAGSNAEAARRAGIKVNRHLVKVYVLQGVLAGFAGFLSLAAYGTTSIAGHTFDNLNAITAVIIGGTSLFGGVGTIFGTVIGVLIPAVLQNGFVIVGVQPYWQQIAVGAVLIMAVYLDRARRTAS